MKFGIFYEHQLPRPWTADSERTLIQHSLEGNARRATIIEGFDALGEPMSTTTAGGVA